MKNIAFIGLGVMGSGMVATLLKHRYAVTVWNRNLSKGGPLKSKGAKIGASIGQAVRGAEVVMISLSNDAAVDEVVFGDGGVLSVVNAGQIVLDTTTVHPDTSRREAAAFMRKRVAFLDTPVFGSKNEAANGGLWVLAGGKRAVFGKVKPILQAIGQTVHYMGETGSGTSMKLVGNLIVASQLQALGEAMVLATKAGLAPADVLEVIGVADFKSPILSGVGAALIKRDFSTSFALKHLLKDANLIDRLAEDLKSPIPAMTAIRETIKAAVNQGWGEENASAMIKALEMAGKTVVGKKKK